MSKLKSFVTKVFTKTEEDKANKKIKTQLQNEQRSANRCIRALLLGAGGSGKTTVVKQMEKIHNGFIDEKDMSKSVEDIRKQILYDIHDLCRYNVKLREENSDCALENSDNEKIVSRLTAASKMILDTSMLTEAFAKDISTVWADVGIKNTLLHRAKANIMDNTAWFLDRVEIISDPNYEGSFDDFVRVRDQTTGVIQVRFNIEMGSKGWIFEITDVGGQRAERRKWLRLFKDNITVVLFVMSLSAYDQVLFEDHTVRALDETFALFEAVTAHPTFECTDFVVFLNKVDIFDAKIAEIPFSVYENTFNEKKASDKKAILRYIRRRFAKIFYAKRKKIAVPTEESLRNPRMLLSAPNQSANNTPTGSIENDNALAATMESVAMDESEVKMDESNAQSSPKSPFDSVDNAHNSKTKRNKHKISRSADNIAGGIAQKRNLHFHVTCATDTKQIETVISMMQLDVVERLLNEAGVMM